MGLFLSYHILKTLTIRLQRATISKAYFYLMEKNSSTKKIFVSLAIYSIKSLIFLKKIVTVFFSFVIFKPIAFIFRTFFGRLFLKLYGSYILLLKKARELSLRYNSKWFVFKKVLPQVSLALMTLIIFGNNLSDQPDYGALSDKMMRAPVSKLIKNEFDASAYEELIVENAVSNKNIVIAPEKYLSQGVVKIIPRANTNTAPLDTSAHSTYQSQLSGGLIKSENIMTEEGRPARTGIVDYIVKGGDTVSSIARSFGISVNTILWENNLGAYSYLHEGDKLRILPVSGVSHKVASGETIQKIATKYGSTLDKIVLANGLPSDGSLSAGQIIIVPDGQKVAAKTTTYRTTNIVKDIVKPASAKTSGAKMLWPTVGYRITQYYSWRHTGLDIANKTGTPLYASEGGTVEYSGWSNGYGYNVVINHGGGMKTRYAHASKLYVSKGDKVAKGEAIAAMGSTGRSTGPHIHFEVIINGAKVNPLNYIK